MAFDFGGKDALIGIDGICEKLGISRSTFERMRKRGVAMLVKTPGFSGIRPAQDEFLGLPDFPEPTVSLGRSPRWSVKDLNAWIEMCGK